MRRSLGLEGSRARSQSLRGPPGYVQLVDPMGGLQRRKSFAAFRDAHKYAEQPSRSNCCGESLVCLLRPCIPASLLARMLPTAFYAKGVHLFKRGVHDVVVSNRVEADTPGNAFARAVLDAHERS